MSEPVLTDDPVALGSLSAPRPSQNPDDRQFGISQGGLVNVLPFESLSAKK